MNEKNSVVDSGSEETDGALIGGMEGIDDLSSSDVSEQNREVIMSK